MNRIILASHGKLSAGMLDTASMILGELPNVYAISTTRDETQTVAQAAEKLLESFGARDDVYILTDMLNGSVNNDMLALVAKHPDITVICGMNACLVLNIAERTDKITPEDLEEIFEQSRAQIDDCTKRLREAMNNHDEEDDDL